MTTATLDPAEAIASAVSEAYDRLRELVDRGPTDDPGLLDELGQLVRRARGRLARARKRAEVSATPEQPAELAPAVQPAVESARQSAVPTPPAARVTLAASPPATDRVSVRLAEPEPDRSDARAIPRPAPARVQPRTQPGRHRWRSRMSRIWAAVTVGADLVTTTVRLILLAVALTLAGYGMFLALEQTDIPWIAVPFAGLYTVAGGALLFFVYRMRRR